MTGAAYLKQYVFNKLVNGGFWQLGKTEIPQQNSPPSEATAVVQHSVLQSIAAR